MAMGDKKHLKKAVGLALGALVVVVFALVPPVASMDGKAMLTLGFLCGAIVWMITNAVPDYVAFLVMSIGWVVTGCAPMKTVYGAFSNNTWWLLLGALGLGVAAAKSGLLRRLALSMMRLFPPTFRGQGLAMTLIGLLVGPLIPSTTAKVAIIGQIGKSISDAMGFGERSRGSAGLFAMFFSSCFVMAPAFLSASFVSYTGVGLFPAGTPAFGWIDWFVSALPWTVITLVLMTAAAFLLYKPREKSAMTRAYVADELKAMGRWKTDEKITAAVLACCLALWMTESLHGISSSMVAVAGMALLLILGIFDRADFRSHIAWDSVILIGVIVGLADVLQATGINDVVCQLLGPVLQPLMQDPWLFIPVYCLLVILIRMLVASMVASIALCSVAIMPLATAVGIHPFVVIFVAYTCAAIWIAPYQNSIYITAQVSTGNYAMASHRQMVPYAVVFVAVMILANLACIPWWRLLGLLP